MFTRVEIEYANPMDLDDSYHLAFKLKEHAVAQKWANMIDIANRKYEIDDPGRFHGFHSKEQQSITALKKINQTIDEINAFDPLIDRPLTDINDQDTLNYLHHIFEVYHGLLDSQSSEYWNRAPDSIRTALANLNLNVHECEKIGRNETRYPSHFTTWYKLKKYLTYDDADYSLFENVVKFGTIYLLYAEIGKTLEDLSVDNDSYIHEDAFKPSRHYSADFFVTFYNGNETKLKNKLDNIKIYYEDHKDFFLNKNLFWGHPWLTPGYYPLADLDPIPDDLLDKLVTRQWVKSITLL
jgi:hypothetical protein